MSEVEPEAGGAPRRRVRLLGDSSILLDWPRLSDAEANRKARSVAARLERESSPEVVKGVEDFVIGARSLLVVFDPLRFDPTRLLRLAAFWENDFAALPAPRLHDVPVCYGGAGGVDLEELAAERGIDPAEFARLHSATEYRVAFLGFSPGFGYLTGLPPLLASPRLATPRLSVPWGSVAIGGSYTGIYPSATPGGWRLIGRTPISLFDPVQACPALLSPGDRVRFVPIEEWRFAALAAGRPRP